MKRVTMRGVISHIRRFRAKLIIALVLCGMNARPLHAQNSPSHWTPLKNLARDSSGNLFEPGSMLLLPDGSVLVSGSWSCPSPGLAKCLPQEWFASFRISEGPM